MACRGLDRDFVSLATAIQTDKVAIVEDLNRLRVTLPEHYRHTNDQACSGGRGGGCDMLCTLPASPAIKFNVSIPNQTGNYALRFILHTSNPLLSVISSAIYSC